MRDDGLLFWIVTLQVAAIALLLLIYQEMVGQIFTVERARKQVIVVHRGGKDPIPIKENEAAIPDSA